MPMRVGKVLKMKKKILLVTFSDNADHQEVIYSLFEEIVSKYDVWAVGIKNPKVPYLSNENIKLVDAPKRPGICKGTFKITEIFKILNFIFKEKFDCIYFETLHIWNIPIWIFHPYKTKIIQAMHDVEPHSGDSSVKSVEMMNRVAVRFADTILLRNASFIELLKNKYNVLENRIKSLDPWRRFPAYKEETHSHRALFFGRINEYKGIEYLPEIVKRCPNVQFDIVGRVDSSVAHIVERLKQEANVNLCTEYVTDEQMQQYFIQDDFVILPYKSASQSGVVLDANKFGRPAIAFSVGAIENQIINNRNGLLIKADDIDAFVESIKRLAEMPDKEMEKFSERTYEYAYERFSSKRAAEHFIRLIEEEI